MKIPYLVHLSNSKFIKIDADELESVVTGISKGSPVFVRQGIFNPSFFVCIVEDKERVRLLLDFNDRNKADILAGTKLPGRFVALPDVFAEISEEDLPQLPDYVRPYPDN